MFKSYGKVIDFHVKKDDKKELRGVVTFDSTKSAIDALKLDGFAVDGSNIIVKL